MSYEDKGTFTSLLGLAAYYIYNNTNLMDMVNELE
jgi:hypothetical protein